MFLILLPVSWFWISTCNIYHIWILIKWMTKWIWGNNPLLTHLPCFSPSVSLSDEGCADICGRKAAHFFSLAETLRSPSVNPFIWVFIRPPWSPTGSCCKAVVFDHLKAECEKSEVGFAAAIYSVSFITNTNGNPNYINFSCYKHKCDHLKMESYK